MDSKFRQTLKQLEDEDSLVRLVAGLMRDGTWEAVADTVLDHIEEVGGEGLEDAVYDRAWGMAYGY